MSTPSEALSQYEAMARRVRELERIRAERDKICATIRSNFGYPDDRQDPHFDYIGRLLSVQLQVEGLMHLNNDLEAEAAALRSQVEEERKKHAEWKRQGTENALAEVDALHAQVEALTKERDEAQREADNTRAMWGEEHAQVEALKAALREARGLCVSIVRGTGDRDFPSWLDAALAGSPAAPAQEKCLPVFREDIDGVLAEHNYGITLDGIAEALDDLIAAKSGSPAAPRLKDAAVCTCRDANVADRDCAMHGRPAAPEAPAYCGVGGCILPPGHQPSDTHQTTFSAAPEAPSTLTPEQVKAALAEGAENAKALDVSQTFRLPEAPLLLAAPEAKTPERCDVLTREIGEDSWPCGNPLPCAEHDDPPAQPKPEAHPLSNPEKLAEVQAEVQRRLKAKREPKPEARTFLDHDAHESRCGWTGIDAESGVGMICECDRRPASPPAAQEVADPCIGCPDGPCKEACETFNRKIRDEAFEEAAKVADEHREEMSDFCGYAPCRCGEILARAIRALATASEKEGER